MDKIAYSVYEVSKLLGISTTSIYSLCRVGAMPSMKLGGRIVIPIKKFNEWLDKGVVI